MNRLLIPILVSGFCIWSEVAQSGTPDRSAELLGTEASWSKAIQLNDVSSIKRFVADEWILYDADGNVISREQFLSMIASGKLQHDEMTLESPVVRIYGTTATVSGVATSSGKYEGHPFKTRERSTDVFVRREGRWQCVLTQLTSLKK